MHVAGQTLWNGVEDAFLGAFPTENDPMAGRVHGPFSDPHELVSSAAWRTAYPRATRALHWNVVAPLMRRVIRQLREEAAVSGGLAVRRS